jgi:hypothetical protein
MTFLTPADGVFLEQISAIAQRNPFLPERIEAEREVLGSEYVEEDPFRSVSIEDPYSRGDNFERINKLLETTLLSLRDRLEAGADASEPALGLYEDAVLQLLYRRHVDSLQDVIEAIEGGAKFEVRSLYTRFRSQWEHLLDIPGVTVPGRLDVSHAFALLFQIQRAYHHIYRFIIGRSMVAARLRAAVWQSIITHDLRRYGTSLYARMTDMTTLITGPSGTGKELVAQAIGFSRYIPFDPGTASFAEDFTGLFLPLNLSALPSTLIESELFGHKRGAFTGAVSDRKGWLDVCGPGGSVFLDEIGDLDPEVQVKLLRVLETRTFQALGDSTDRHFHGKIIAATNRDLAKEMHQGRFREDFYFRLCSDTIRTPSLREQLTESPEMLGELLRFVMRRVAGENADGLAEEVERWIEQHLGSDYPWPGNVRELEQCARSFLIRREYTPTHPPPAGALERFATDVKLGALTADELLMRYCTLVYAQTRNYQETARRLGLDRRTVKSRIDPEMLADLGDGP